eukprot:gene32695-39528_t
MSLLVLDKFLRVIWLECCGHLSKFSVSHPTIGKKTLLQDAGSKMDYEYDFGSSTYLTVTIEGTLADVPSNRIVVLARNDFPTEICEVCKACNATSLFHWDDLSPVCEECKAQKKQELRESLRRSSGWADSADETAERVCKPIINSPRVGQCCFAGPAEDIDSFLDTTGGVASVDSAEQEDF